MKTRSEAKRKATALAVAPKGQKPVKASARERQLDDLVKRIREGSSDLNASAWRLGKLIAEVHDEGLWRLRVSAEGKPFYKGFNAFAEAELGITYQYAHTLRDVAGKYTEEQVRALGVTRAALLLQAPEQDRKRLEQHAAKGSTRELRDAVSEIKQRTGFQKPSSKNVPQNAGKPKMRKRSEVGSKTADLLAREAAMPAAPAPDPGAEPVACFLKRADSWAVLNPGTRERARAWTDKGLDVVLQCEGEVGRRVRIRIRRDDDGLVAHVVVQDPEAVQAAAE